MAGRPGNNVPDVSGIKNSSRRNDMSKKVIDLMTYRIEKTLKDNGFEVKKDDNRNVKILIKLNNNE